MSKQASDRRSGKAKQDRTDAYIALDRGAMASAKFDAYYKARAAVMPGPGVESRVPCPAWLTRRTDRPSPSSARTNGMSSKPPSATRCPRPSASPHAARSCPRARGWALLAPSSAGPLTRVPARLRREIEQDLAFGEGEVTVGDEPVAPLRCVGPIPTYTRAAPSHRAPRVFHPSRRLPWYPGGLAYQLDVSRKDLRKHPVLRKIQKWLVKHTDAGSVTRQEAVSMIPTHLLGVRPHHKVPAAAPTLPSGPPSLTLLPRRSWTCARRLGPRPRS